MYTFGGSVSFTNTSPMLNCLRPQSRSSFKTVKHCGVQTFDKFVGIQTLTKLLDMRSAHFSFTEVDSVKLLTPSSHLAPGVWACTHLAEYLNPAACSLVM